MAIGIPLLWCSGKLREKKAKSKEWCTNTADTATGIEELYTTVSLVTASPRVFWCAEETNPSTPARSNWARPSTPLWFSKRRACNRYLTDTDTKTLHSNKHSKGHIEQKAINKISFFRLGGSDISLARKAVARGISTTELDNKMWATPHWKRCFPAVRAVSNTFWPKHTPETLITSYLPRQFTFKHLHKPFIS